MNLTKLIYLSETLETDGTDIGFFTRVGSHVNIQRFLFRESLLTRLTLKIVLGIR